MPVFNRKKGMKTGKRDVPKVRPQCEEVAKNSPRPGQQDGGNGKILGAPLNPSAASWRQTTKHSAMAGYPERGKRKIRLGEGFTDIIYV